MTTIHIEPHPRIAVEFEGRGPLLVFLHGIGGNRSNWREQLPFFAAADFTAAAWDARGYGSSDDYDAPLDFGDFSADLQRVLDFVDVEQAHLCGLSMGGRIIMDFYERHANRVATLTLCDTQPGLGAMSKEKRRDFIRLRQEPLLQGKPLSDVAPVVAKTLVSPKSPAEAFHKLVDSMCALHRDSYLKTIEASFLYDRSPALERIRVPTHVVVGADDLLTPPAVARAMVERIEGAALTVIADAGHLSNLEKPDDFNDAVLGFLRPYRLRAGVPREPTR